MSELLARALRSTPGAQKRPYVSMAAPLLQELIREGSPLLQKRAALGTGHTSEPGLWFFNGVRLRGGAAEPDMLQVLTREGRWIHFRPPLELQEHLVTSYQTARGQRLSLPETTAFLARYPSEEDTPARELYLRLTLDGMSSFKALEAAECLLET